MLVLMASITVSAQNQTYKLSTHVLDNYAGIPGKDVKVELYKQGDDANEWILVDERISDHDGRVKDFLNNNEDHQGLYRIRFFSREYCKEKYGTDSIYPYIDVVVELGNEAHYHIPIAIAPFGYSTYKGR